MYIITAHNIQYGVTFSCMARLCDHQMMCWTIENCPKNVSQEAVKSIDSHLPALRLYGFILDA